MRWTAASTAPPAPSASTTSSSRTSGAFARFTRAFRLPSLGDFITNPTNTAPRTQKFTLIEGGLKVVRPKFSVFLTAFYTGFDSQNFTETRFDQPTNSYISTTQFAATKAYGVELEGQIRPTEWFDVSFNATAQDPKLGHFIFNERVAKAAGACPLPSDAPTAGRTACGPATSPTTPRSARPRSAAGSPPGSTSWTASCAPRSTCNITASASRTWPTRSPFRPTT